jgi:hypothetical protein
MSKETASQRLERIKKEKYINTLFMVKISIQKILIDLSGMDFMLKTEPCKVKMIILSTLCLELSS